jgi:anti-anti-sigma factor
MPDAASSTSVFAHMTFAAGVLSARLTGPSIGQREVPIITDLIVGELDQHSRDLKLLVLDMSQITFLNSMGLGMCVDFRNRVSKLGGKTAIVGLNEELTKLFKMVRFDKLFTIVKNASELAK